MSVPVVCMLSLEMCSSAIATAVSAVTTVQRASPSPEVNFHFKTAYFIVLQAMRHCNCVRTCCRAAYLPVRSLGRCQPPRCLHRITSESYCIKSSKNSHIRACRLHLARDMTSLETLPHRRRRPLSSTESRLQSTFSDEVRFCIEAGSQQPAAMVYLPRVSCLRCSQIGHQTVHIVRKLCLFQVRL